MDKLNNLKLNIMKTKFKDFLLYSLACIGAVSLFLSVSNTDDDYSNENNQVGTYAIAAAEGVLFRVNTSTGDIKRIKKSNIGKLDLRKD